jgi:NAD(P)H-dependent FMN reductase
MPPRILAFGGSLRRASLNQQLVEVAAQGARDAGADVTTIHLADYPLPIFNADLEESEGSSSQCLALRRLLASHDGFLIASPEYNSSISSALKNVIDWCSRPQDGCPPLHCFDGKVAGLLAASPGAHGGLRGLTTVRLILSNIKVIVLPNQIAVGRAHDALATPGRVEPQALHELVLRVGQDVADTCRRLSGD